MTHSSPPDPVLKQLVKEAVREALLEQREWLQDAIAEVLEEMALDEALREVEALEHGPQPKVFGIFEGEA